MQIATKALRHEGMVIHLCDFASQFCSNYLYEKISVR